MPDISVRCANAECSENGVVKTGSVSTPELPITCGVCGETCEPSEPEPEPELVEPNE